jgi:membrane associated rhomboid family serine protease
MRGAPPRATIVLVAATGLAWAFLFAAGQSERAAYAAGFIPARAFLDLSRTGLGCFLPFAVTPLTATLVHGGLMHLLFNLSVLGYCGRFVEGALGTGRFLLLYALGAYAAAAAQFAAGPTSLVPMIGASGAVSAVLAVQAVLFGRRRIAPGGQATSHAVQLLWLAAAWIGLQFLTEIAMRGTIAVAAHVGGFLAGLVLARPLARGRFRR